MHRNPCRKNAIEEGVKLNSASHNQSKKFVRALHEHFQKFNNVTNLDKCISDSDCCTAWKLCPKLACQTDPISQGLFFKNVTCAKGMKRFQSPAYCVLQEFWDTTYFNHIAETRNERCNTQQKSKQFTLY